MISQKLDVLKTMPPLYHRIPGKEFDPNESPVLDWLSMQTDLLSWLKDRARENGFIVYDSETGRWQGVDYDD